MKNMAKRFLALALVLCLSFSLIPSVFGAVAAAPAPGTIQMSIDAQLQNDGSYEVSYNARLVMLTELARAAASFRTDERMEGLRFVCILEDELLAQVSDTMDEGDFRFTSAKWNGRDIFVFDGIEKTADGFEISYYLDKSVLADWRYASAASVEAALLQTMTMSASKTFAASVVEPLDGMRSDGRVELRGEGIRKYYGQSSVVGAKGYAYLNVDTEAEKPGQGGHGGHGYMDCPRNQYCPAWPFKDLNLQLWYHDGIHFCVEHGLMNGMSGTVFSPDGPITRGQLVTILWRMEGEPTAAQAATFDDVLAGKFYFNAVAWAAENGIVTGHSPVKYAPDDPVTREQMAAIMWRYAKYKNYDVSVGESTNLRSFYDYAKVSGYAVPALQWAVGAGMVNGANGNLMPAGTTTRAQAAAIIQRFCVNVAKW